MVLLLPDGKVVLKEVTHMIELRDSLLLLDHGLGRKCMGPKLIGVLLLLNVLGFFHGRVYDES